MGDTVYHHFVLLCLFESVTNCWFYRLNMVFKNNKRPYSEDEPCHISYKRQLDYTSFEGFGPCNNSPEKPHTSGNTFNKFFAFDIVTD